MYTHQAGRKPALQPNWQSSEKSKHFKEKTQYLMNTLYLIIESSRFIFRQRKKRKWEEKQALRKSGNFDANKKVKRRRKYLGLSVIFSPLHSL